MIVSSKNENGIRREKGVVKRDNELTSEKGRGKFGREEIV